MDPILNLLLALAAGWMIKSRVQQQRIALLARYLSRFSIEKHIEAVTQGYLRALGEDKLGRREQIWQLLQDQEQALCRQALQLANDFGAASAAATRVSKLPLWLPFASRLPASFDMREALRVHARGICRAVEGNNGASARDRAYAISAELLLLQHTCHWFCRSKWIASARMRSRHGTSYEQALASVLPQTRVEYLALVALGGRN